jgi:cell division protein ZapE
MSSSSALPPLARYQQDLQRDDFSYDASQEVAVKHLQRLYDDLVKDQAEQPKVGMFSRFFSKEKPKTPVKGLYFWGGVGRGKTYLMDTFFESLPFARKNRTHFHRFMQRVHADLNGLVGQKDPLDIIAKKYAQESCIICFDEFFVSDITDAMILGGLFERLFAQGVSLVATSNIVPDGLYLNGLQRARFLPAIALLKEHTEIVNVDGGVDYRLRVLEQAQLYYSPLGAAADVSLNTSFENLAPDLNEVVECEAIEVNGRQIISRRCCEDVVWFDFEAICLGARSQNDYIELAKIYHAVLVSNVPQLGRENDDAARRFINLVDEFYDSGVKLILSAAVPIFEIYTEGKLSFEIERTKSRLLEMQSHEYLAKAHKA